MDLEGEGVGNDFIGGIQEIDGMLVSNIVWVTKLRYEFIFPLLIMLPNE